MYNMNEELMDFVEWLPNNSELFADMDVEAIIAQINDLASSDEGKETLEQLTKQYKSKEMGLFKKGGKLNYLLCLKKGGKVQDCGCGKKIEKAQGGNSSIGYTNEQKEKIRKGMYSNVYTDPFGNKVEEYSWDLDRQGDPAVVGRLTTPDGKQLYSMKMHDEKTMEPFYGYERQYSEEGSDSRIRQAFDRNYERFNRGPIDADKLFETMDKYGGKYFLKPQSFQPGGEISRRDALNMLRTTGSSNKESRREYRDAKREARPSGLRGNKMRNAARSATMARGVDRIMPILDDTVEIVDRPIEDRLEALPTISRMAVADVPRGIITTPRVQERPEILTFQGDFNTAFGNARKMGEDRFYWNDEEYTTDLRDPNRLAIHTAPSADDSFVEKYVPANHNPGGMPAPAYDVLYTLGANLRKNRK